MRKINLPFLLLMPVFLCSVLAGCSPSVENCNAPDITNLVAQAASTEIANQMGEEVAKTLSYEVKAITITGTNEKTGAYDCAAELIISGNDKNSARPITYSVNKKKDGELYVDVSGV